MNKIVNQDTLIPLGLAVAVIGSVAVWVSNMRNQLDLTAQKVEALQHTQDSNFKLIYEINARLSRIEWKLEKP